MFGGCEVLCTVDLVVSSLWLMGPLTLLAPRSCCLNNNHKRVTSFKIAVMPTYDTISSIAYAVFCVAVLRSDLAIMRTRAHTIRPQHARQRSMLFLLMDHTLKHAFLTSLQTCIWSISNLQLAQTAQRSPAVEASDTLSHGDVQHHLSQVVTGETPLCGLFDTAPAPGRDTDVCACTTNTPSTAGQIKHRHDWKLRTSCTNCKRLQPSIVPCGSHGSGHMVALLPLMSGQSNIRVILHLIN
jgi:hypothetical protein